MNTKDHNDEIVSVVITHLDEKIIAYALGVLYGAPALVEAHNKLMPDDTFTVYDVLKASNRFNNQNASQAK